MALGRLYEANIVSTRQASSTAFVLQRDPKSADALLALGRVEIMSGNAQSGLDYFERAEVWPSRTTTRSKTPPALHAMGVAYETLNKPEEALQNLKKALAIRRKIGQKRGMAASLNEMGKVRLKLGEHQDRIRPAFRRHSTIRREIGDKRGVGGTLLDLGNFYDDKRRSRHSPETATSNRCRLQRDIGNESLQAICLNNIGNAYFDKGHYEDALTYFQQALQLREKAQVPQDIVESVHNLAETSAYMGQYDQAITQYMRALDLRRSIGDTRGARPSSPTAWARFRYQGRFGAALNSKAEALKTFRDIKDRTFWMAEILGGYGDALIVAGRGDEGRKYLEEALTLSRELKNDGMTAQALGFQGDAAFVHGDYKTAKSLYEKADQAAARTTETDKKLIAKLNLAKLAVQEGRGREAITTLRPLSEKAETLGLKYMAVQCSLLMAEAMVQMKDYAHAKPELEQILLRSDKLGLQPLSGKAHFLLATIARASGKSADAQDQYRQVVRLLEPMSKQKGAEKVLQRSDLSAIYTESSKNAGK